MKRYVLAAMALVAPAVSVVAQAPITAQLGAPRIGVTAGLNLARLSGGDVPGPENKAGFGGGVYLAIPVTSQFEFQPELLYSAKGVKNSEAGVEAAIHLNYVEIPLLARVNFPSSSAVTPLLYVGPAVAFKVGCSISASGNGISASSNCDDLQNGQNDGVATVDYGVVAGGGLGFNVAGRRATVGVRYDLGLKNIAPSGGGDVKNRTLSFLASFEFPLPR